MKTAWLLQTSALCAVDCYAIISGYVSYREQEKECRYARYLSIWIPAFLYSFGITVATYFLVPSAVGLKALIKSMAVAGTGRYWYVTAYTGLFFVEPFLNKAIQAASEKLLNSTMRLVLLLFCVYGNLWDDPFKLNAGYGFAWLAILYLLGAWMKKCRVAEKLDAVKWTAILSGCIVLAWVWKVWGIYKKDMFVRYTSITIVLVAVSLVAIFSQLKIQSKKSQRAIEFLAPAAFGVYLIHDQEFTRAYLMHDRFIWIASLAAWKIPFAVLICALEIFAGCLLIERVRLSLFEMVKLNRLIQKVQKMMDNCINRYILKD